MIMNSDDQHRIRAVLLDFGGVIAEEGFRDGLRALAERQGLDPDAVSREGRLAVHDSGYVTGAGSESDFWALLRRRTGLAGADAELTRAILDRFIVRPWMIDLARRLRAEGLTVAILSDQTDWLERLDARQRFGEAFDRVFNSYRLGRSKREPGLFDAVVASLGLVPGQALFVDDDSGNVERARQRGLHAIRYDSRESFETQLQTVLGPRLAGWPPARRQGDRGFLD